MLQAIRSKATSAVIKVLFALLIVSFGVWGVGDIFRNRGVDDTVATVGGRSITVEQLNQTVRGEMERLRSILGNDIDTEQAKRLGIVDSALQRLVGQDLVDLEIDRLGLAVGDATVRQAIVANPNFRNESGAFDRDVYARVLAANRMSEAQYEALLRHDIARSELLGALTDGLTPPSLLVDILFRARNERRVADLVTLPPDAAGPVREPTEEELTAFHDAHPDRFRTPELRSFSVALLRLDDVAAAIKPSEDKLRQEYQARGDEFHTAEQRQIQQLLLPDEAKAKEAEASLAAGKNFATVAKEVANAAPDTLDLGWITRAELPDKLADAAFSLKPGEVTKPIQTSFGWHILRVVATKPEETQPFDAVKDKLAREVARDMAGDQIAKLANDIEDALAGGGSFAAVAQKFGLKTDQVADVDLGGRNAQAQPVAMPQPSTNILRTAFNTDAGQTSDLTEMGEDGYYLVHVDKVTPAAVKPLAEVRDQAATLWQAEQRSNALGKLADEIVGEVNAGKSLKAVAADRKLAVTATPPLQHTGGDAQVPPALVAKLFEIKPGASAAAPAGDGYAVAQLAEIQPADPEKEKAAVDQLSRQLGAAMQNDFVEEYDKALRTQFPVEINRANLDRVL